MFSINQVCCFSSGLSRPLGLSSPPAHMPLLDLLSPHAAPHPPLCVSIPLYLTRMQRHSCLSPSAADSDAVGQCYALASRGNGGQAVTGRGGGGPVSPETIPCPCTQAIVTSSHAFLPIASHWSWTIGPHHLVSHPPQFQPSLLCWIILLNHHGVTCFVVLGPCPFALGRSSR